MLLGLPVGKSKIQYFINQAYVDYVHDAGFEPMQINPKNDLTTVVNMCDGLILPGGIDIDPVYYDRDNLNSYAVDPEKDAFERALLHEFIAAGKPIFGICRGLQLIAWEIMLHINTGKRLAFAQHIDDHSLATDLSIGRNVRAHSVVANTNVLYGKKGKNRDVRIYVNSMHHQCLLYSTKKDLPSGDLPEIGFEVLAYTKIGLSKKEEPSTVIIEAFRMNWAASKILAVQWHPEELEDNHLLSNFFLNQNEQEAEAQNAD